LIFYPVLKPLTRTIALKVRAAPKLPSARPQGRELVTLSASEGSLLAKKRFFASLRMTVKGQCNSSALKVTFYRIRILRYNEAVFMHICTFAGGERSQGMTYSFWQGVNEPAIDSPEAMQRYADLEAERARVMDSHGFRVVVGSFSVGAYL